MTQSEQEELRYEYDAGYTTLVVGKKCYYRQGAIEEVSDNDFRDLAGGEYKVKDLIDRILTDDEKLELEDLDARGYTMLEYNDARMCWYAHRYDGRGVMCDNLYLNLDKKHKQFIDELL